MTFKQAYDDVMRDLGDPDHDDDLLVAVKKGLQDGVRQAPRVCERGWSWTKRDARIHLPAPVDCKATATNAAYELSCVSATASHAGWRVVFDGQDQTARIRALKQSGVAYLESAWPRPTVAAGDASLVQDRVRLPADFVRLLPGKDELHAEEIFILDDRAFDAAIVGWGGATGVTQYVKILGKAKEFGLGDWYNTGTLKPTVGSVSATLSGGALDQAAVGKHLRMAGDEVMYRIASVPGSTSCIFDRPYGGSLSALTAYAIEPADRCYVMELMLAADEEHEATFPYMAAMDVPELSTHQMPGDPNFQDILKHVGREYGWNFLGESERARQEHGLYEVRLRDHEGRDKGRAPGWGRVRIVGGRRPVGGRRWKPFG